MEYTVPEPTVEELVTALRLLGFDVALTADDARSDRQVKAELTGALEAVIQAHFRQYTDQMAAAVNGYHGVRRLTSDEECRCGSPCEDRETDLAFTMTPTERGVR